MDYHFFHGIKKIYGHLEEPIILINKYGEIQYKNPKAIQIIDNFSVKNNLKFLPNELMEWLSIRGKKIKNNKRRILSIEENGSICFYVHADILFLQEQELFVIRIVNVLKDRESFHPAIKLYEKIIQVFNEFNQGVIISDIKGRILTYNQIASNTFHFSTPQGTPIQYEDFLNKFEYNLEDMINYYKEIGLNHYAEFSVTYKSQNEKTEYKLISLIQEDSQILMTTFLTDEQSNNVGPDLILKKIGENATKIIHEINNPLTTLNGYVNLLIEKADINQEYLKMIKQELLNIEILTTDLLYLSNPKHDHYSEISLIPIINQCIELLKIEAKKANCVISFHYESKNDYEIIGNATRIKQVLVNLIKNSLEAMIEKDQLNLIDIYLEEYNKHCKICIKDNGPGMSKEIKNQIFTPFFTTKTRGTGLGLSISQQYIKEHQGKMEVESSLGEGTIFTLELPKKIEAPSLLLPR